MANGTVRLIFGAGLLALTATPGAAASALATGDVNMRASPSTSAPVVQTIPGGSNVEVLGCGSGWCEVVFGGRAGHAIQQRFDFGGGPPPPPRQSGPPRGYGQPAYPPPGYREPVYPQPYPGPAYSPDYRDPYYPQAAYPPPMPSPYGRDDDDEVYSPTLPPPGLDPRALPQRPPQTQSPAKPQRGN